jgi:CheY-like chemotaxis protein
MRREMNFQTVPLAELAARGVTPDPDHKIPLVLVVDDEALIADTLAAILRQSGVPAVTAYDGETGLEAVRLLSPDLLLTDVAMPVMNGIDLAIATRQSLPTCKILLFSGQALTADLLSKARSAGQDFTILSKPLHPTQLLAHISKTLDFSVTTIRQQHSHAIKTSPDMHGLDGA